MQVSENSGRSWLRSAGVVIEGLPRPSSPPEAPGDEVYEDVVIPGVGLCRMCSKSIKGPDATLLVQAAMSTDINQRHLGELRRVFAYTGPALLVAALGCGYLLARKALAPVERLAAEADQITASRLDRRLATPNPDDELGRLARTLNGMIARLEHSFGDIQRFTADAAHELRTPLAALRSEAEVTLLAERDPAEYRRTLVSMLEEIEHLTQLTEDLLSLCREDANVRPSFEDLRFDEVASEAFAAMLPVAAKVGQRLVAPDDLTPCIVHGDRDQLHRVAVNLIDNALKYTPAGGRVDVSLTLHDGEARLTVADDGVGIPPEHLPLIFDRFYRVDASRPRRSTSTGLGLPICRSTVQSHGGTIEIQSEPDVGTRVIVTLAARPVEPARREESAHARRF
jgi:heavy metal sensor kinase